MNPPRGRAVNVVGARGRRTGRPSSDGVTRALTISRDAARDAKKRTSVLGFAWISVRRSATAGSMLPFYCGDRVFLATSLCSRDVWIRLVR